MNKYIVPQPITLNDTTTLCMSSAMCNNGNTLITYRDVDDLGKGKFVIVDEVGRVVVPVKTFSDSSAVHISTTRLRNGDMIIAYIDYGDYGKGKLVIVRDNGAIIVPAKIFDPVGIEGVATRIDIAVTALSNGNALIVYPNGYTPTKGKLVIVDPSGAILVDKVFNSTSTSFVSATLLKNGNVFITYIDECKGRKGMFIIVDQEGNTLTPATIFIDTPTAFVNTVLLNNGSVFVSYRGIGNGLYTIIDPIDDTATSPIVFHTANITQPNAIVLNSGKVLIVYTDDQAGKFTVVDPNNDSTPTPTTFSNIVTAHSPPVLLKNSKVFIPYSDINTGKLVTIDLNKSENVSGGVGDDLWFTHPKVGCRGLSITDTVNDNLKESDASGEFLVIYTEANLNYRIPTTLASDYHAVHSVLKNARTTSVCKTLSHLESDSGNLLAKLLLDEFQDLKSYGVIEVIINNIATEVCAAIRRNKVHTLPVTFIPVEKSKAIELIRDESSVRKLLVLSKVYNSVL